MARKVYKHGAATPEKGMMKVKGWPINLMFFKFKK
jgi:hypothetical protein